MPTAFVKKLGRNGEHLWSKAKGIVDKEYGVSHKSDRYWSLVTGIAKKMAGKDEDVVATLADLLVEGHSFEDLLGACCASCSLGGACDVVSEDGIRPRTRPWNLTQSKKMDPKDKDGSVNPDDNDDDEEDDDDA